MSDPHALPDQPKTRRVDPLQPDNPGKGAEADPGAGAPAKPTEESPGKQSERALENVREGYGGPSTD